MGSGHNQLLQLLDIYFKVRNASFLNEWIWTKHGLENEMILLCECFTILLPCDS